MAGAIFDHEKLDVYRVELDVLAYATELVSEVMSNNPTAGRLVCDHLDRVALSVLPNGAEGNGKRQRAIRAKYFDDARGSAAECAACLDALVAKGLCTAERVAEGKAALARVAAMLSRLVERFSTERRVREEEGEYSTTNARADRQETETNESEREDENEGDDEEETEDEDED